MHWPFKFLVGVLYHFAHSTDYVAQGDDNSLQLQQEFLNSLKVSGLPPHELNLREGVPIILIRNFKSSGRIVQWNSIPCCSITKTPYPS